MNSCAVRQAAGFFNCRAFLVSGYGAACNGPPFLLSRLFRKNTDKRKFRQVDAHGITAAKIHNGCLNVIVPRAQGCNLSNSAPSFGLVQPAFQHILHVCSDSNLAAGADPVLSLGPQLPFNGISRCDLARCPAMDIKPNAALLMLATGDAMTGATTRQKQSAGGDYKGNEFSHGMLVNTEASAWLRLARAPTLPVEPTRNVGARNNRRFDFILLI